MILHSSQPQKIYYQGVDTLRTAHIFKEFDSYLLYEKILDELRIYKMRAIESNMGYEFEGGISFEFRSFGKFFIRPKGQGRYKYVIYNEDIEIFFSTVRFGANNFDTPQIVVDYRAKYLSLLGHEKAFALVQSMLETFFLTDKTFLYDQVFKTQLMRIDLCTDYGGIDYVPMDKYRFQTNFKKQGHIEFKEHLQFNRLTGFSFGKGDYMMRIYNKRHQLNNDASKLWLVALWVENGYSQDRKDSVWRHEVQMRRPYLKRFRKERLVNEVDYFFKMLGGLWTFAFLKVQYVNITDDQVINIMNCTYTPDALKKMFQRTKKNNPSFVFNEASTWQGKCYPEPEKIVYIKTTDYSVAKRFLKGFVTAAYKSAGGDPSSVIRIMELVTEDMQLNDGINFHDYGSNRLLSSFIDNAQYITEYGFTIDKDYRNLAADLYSGMMEKFLSVDNEEFDKNEIKLAQLYSMTVSELRENINDVLSIAADEDQGRVYRLGIDPIVIEYSE